MALTDFYNVSPTDDQLNAIAKLESFLNGEDQVFLLKGYAGTGKTTLLKGLCQYIARENKDYKILAPTGRAAMILRNKTGMDANTIHRCIYNMDDIQEEKEGTSFKFYFGLYPNEESSECVYLVDEASMISDYFNDDEFFRFGSGYLLNDLMSYASLTNTKRKIIFVGDNAQLPPVNMAFSPALSKQYFEDQYNITTKEVTLSQVIRQHQNTGILDNATRIRKALDTGRFNQFKINDNNDDTTRILPENFIRSYDKEAKINKVENCIVITHSNHQALAYNDEIRTKRFGENVKNLRERDRLLITKNNYNGPVELFNGMFVEVLEVGELSYQAKPRFNIEGGKVIERELLFRDVTVNVPDIKGNNRELRTTLIDNFLRAKEGKLHPYDQRALYIDFKNRMREKGIKENSSEFKKMLRTDHYFNALQVKFGYAVTCHKSQGGEWPVTFVDFNVFFGRMSKAFFRWSYTAITRSKQKFYSIDAPDFNAFNQFDIGPVEKLANVLKGAYHIPSNEIDPYYFINYRKKQLRDICEKQEIKLNIREHNNQLDVSFEQNDKFVRVQLWNSRKGFTRTTWHSSNDENFKSLIKDLLLESILPNEVPFKPRFDFQKELNDYILELLHEEGIPLTNILQHDWKDQYFIYTGADCAVIEFYFNSRYIYTKAQPKSTLGNDDEKLKRLVSKLKGDMG